MARPTSCQRRAYWKSVTNPICTYCAESLTEQNRSIDHIVPLAHGGTNKFKNLQPLCHACNNWKGEKLRVPTIALGSQYAASLHAQGYCVTSVAREKIVPFKPDHAPRSRYIWFVVGDPVRHLLNCFHFEQPEVTGE